MKNNDINHIHFETIESTQKYLINHFDHSLPNTLVTCISQTNAHGQHGRTWDSYAGNLEFSFSLKPCEQLTLTSLEIPILVKEYFGIDLKFKWPNDLLNSNLEKCGGLIINNANDGYVIVGIGINFTKNQIKNNYPIKAGSINYSIKNVNQEAKSLYQYILNNRVDEKKIIPKWLASCAHLNQEIFYTEQNSRSSGKFIGLGNRGQAQILCKDGIKEIYSGSVILR